jgi:hypothetical protein
MTETPKIRTCEPFELNIIRLRALESSMKLLPMILPTTHQSAGGFQDEQTC